MTSTVGIVGLLLTMGCAADPTLDAASLEQVLPAQIVPDHPEVVTNVQCPTPIEMSAGISVVCTAEVGGDPVTMTVTQLDDVGSVTAELDQPLFDVEASADVLAAQLTDDLAIATTIVCVGPAVRVLDVGEVLSCVASDPSGRSRPLFVTIVDEAGTLDMKLG
ncbi:MAG: DUF4333 domain-containing protein [Actinomycetota bacterium]|nr:DUF4333 domain-containing protein [Actinomycetota bacterium]